MTESATIKNTDSIGRQKDNRKRTQQTEETKTINTLNKKDIQR